MKTTALYEGIEMVVEAFLVSAINISVESVGKCQHIWNHNN